MAFHRRRSACKSRDGSLPRERTTITATITPTNTATITPTVTATPTPTPTATPVGPVIYSTNELKFPPTKVGRVSALKFVTITNPRKNKVAVSITGVALQSQGKSGFSVDNYRTTCLAGQSVAAGKNCKVAIFFAPIVSVPASDILTITGNMTNSGSPIALIGTAR